MRFLILTQYFVPEVGAAQLRLAAVVRELVRLGHEVEIVTALPNYPTGRIFSDYARCLYRREQWEALPGKPVTIHRVWVYPSMGRTVKRLLNFVSFMLLSPIGLALSRKPDYLFVETPPAFLGLTALVFTRLWHARLIVNVADLWLDALSYLGYVREGLALRTAMWLERWIYRQADFVTAVTEGLHEKLIQKKGMPASRVLFLPNGVDTDLFRPTARDVDLERKLGLEGKQVMLYAGTHGYAHGIEVALHAARILDHSSNPTDREIRFVFIGGGSEKGALMAKAQEMNLNNVLFLDPAPPAEIARLYSLAVAGLSTLRLSPQFEGIRPVKIFAAMASGKPVLYSGAGEGARIIEDADAGLVTRPEDPDDLVQAARLLAEQPERAARMGQNGRRFAEEHLTWTALVQDWLAQLSRAEKQSACTRKPGGETPNAEASGKGPATGTTY